ncbi:cytochrome P450 [Artomyces pyxidatus]|uniref:Cytochrome P450 n=1 Tax=Artomyces pyxidatus TaxID=48021 RepID=A0ACB8SS27_9AGAM|nr:cytochrome P450 [Artomyces pyxidatus]
MLTDILRAPPSSTLVWRGVALSVLSVVAALVFRIARSRIRQASLWKIPGPPSVSLITGNFSQMFNSSASKYHAHITRTYGRVIRLTGLLGESHLVISDTKALTNILLQGQGAVFDTPEWVLESNTRIIGPGLLSQGGVHHRRQRKMLQPFFSTKHMRSLVPLCHRVIHQLDVVLQQKLADGPKEVELLDWLGRLALELIAQAGMGYTFNSLSPSGEEHEFDTALKEYMPTISSIIFLRRLAPQAASWPPWLLRLGGTLLPSPMLHRMMSIADTIERHSVQIFQEKSALLAGGDDEFTHQLSEGKDIISVLMRANMTASGEDRLPDSEITGQMATFLIGGTDTTSSAIARTLLLLAHHPEAQERLRKEINDAYVSSGDSELDYDELAGMAYLDAVCRETLRVYPPVNFAARVCRADTSVPLSEPVQTSGGAISSLFIPQGTNLLMNIGGVNRDPRIWGTDAEEWRPERFLAPLPESVAEARIPGVLSNLMTFSGGPRSCIGFQFAQLEMKVALSHLVRAFRFSPSTKEIVWRYGVVTTPSVEGTDAVGTEMPIIVERI